MKVLRCTLALAILMAGAVFAIQADASSITTEVLETMMEAYANESLFIGHYFGVDTNNSVEYDFIVDYGSRTFSLNSQNDQTYLGETMSLSMSGSYDDNTGIYSWTSSGTISGETWTSAGSVEWIGDPKGTVSTTITIGGKEYTVTGNVEWEQGVINATSKGSYTFKSANGTTYGPYKGTDMWNINTGEWDHEVTVPKNPVTPDGFVTFSSGITQDNPQAKLIIGKFQNSITPIPEASTVFLLGVGLIGLVAFRKKMKP